MFYFSYSIHECRREDIFKGVTESRGGSAAFPRGGQAGMRRSGLGWEAGARGWAGLRLPLGLPLLSRFPFHPAFNPRVCLENKFFIASVL